MLVASINPCPCGFRRRHLFLCLSEQLTRTTPPRTSGWFRRNRIYWDACVYLAWLKNEEATYGKDRMDAIQKILKG
jgi:predicted ATPase with chaperone activity